MSLTGALEAFPLPEVLRLLARSNKSGTLRVDGADLQGRIYLTDGSLTYATTRREEDLADDLVGAGLIDSQDWVLVERREKDVVEVLGEHATKQQLTDLLADQIADVIFRLMRRTDGDFEFSESVGPRYNTGIIIDIDASIAEAERRNTQWTEIEQVIPAITFHLRMVPDLTDRNEVPVPAAHWRILAALHGEGSIEEVARRLGMTDFAVAQIMAGLARDGLLEVVDMPPPAGYGYGEDPSAVQEVAPEPPRESPDEPDVDDEVLLRSALSDVVATDDGQEVPALARKRGLGARVQEAKEAGE
ncbi:MAG: DUF4388 domain-containing protein [Acidimicrobiia bacterium]|nr:DUF4388 domain-containing protein [Acidimicrobiia bacterium]MDH3397675.1 DUF4388 domain-containing protein [Acidimicrobiia bacterium]